MKALTLFVAIATLSGCATCERHPVMCTTAVVLVAGSIAIAANHSHAGEFYNPPREADHGHRTHDVATCVPTAVLMQPGAGGC